jgi:plasmid maintenance system antidote protein VapI
MTEQLDPAMTSTLEELQNAPRSRAELAVAEFQLRMEELLEQAVDSISHLDVAFIAHTLDVDEARVERVLDGTDRLKAESFIRYASLLGFSPQLGLVRTDAAAGDDMPPDAAIGQSVRHEFTHHYKQLGATTQGLSTIVWQQHTTSLDTIPLTPIEYERTTDRDGHVVSVRSATFSATFELHSDTERLSGAHV